MTHRWSKNSGRRSQKRSGARQQIQLKAAPAEQDDAPRPDSRQAIAEAHEKYIEHLVDFGLTEREAHEEHPNLLVN